jgi:hypothetical protein
VRTVPYPPVLYLHAQRDFWKINPAHYEIQESEIRRIQTIGREILRRSHEIDFANSKIEESKTQLSYTFRRARLSKPRVMRETLRTQRFRIVELSVLIHSGE